MRLAYVTWTLSAGDNVHVSRFLRNLSCSAPGRVSLCRVFLHFRFHPELLFHAHSPPEGHCSLLSGDVLSCTSCLDGFSHRISRTKPAGVHDYSAGWLQPTEWQCLRAPGSAESAHLATRPRFPSGRLAPFPCLCSRGPSSCSLTLLSSRGPGRAAQHPPRLLPGLGPACLGSPSSSHGAPPPRLSGQVSSSGFGSAAASLTSERWLLNP